ncbi:MAG: hypothetical protein FWC73_07230 [Defluviitaleaceae bacterium]|nr:hypothetical protein [Defluviitaleaceae bacterium]
MAKRKHQNLEIERQLKHRRLIFRIITLCVAAILLVAIGMGIWTVQDRRWAMRYDGGRVSTSDFRAMMDLQFEGAIDDPAARSAAVTTLQGITMILDRANTHNISLSTEEWDEAVLNAENTRMQIQMSWGGFDGIGYITNERIAELFNTGPLISGLMDIYVPTYDIDEEAFTEMWEEYQETSIHNFWDIQINIVELETEELAQEAYEAVGTMPFVDLIRQFTPWMDEDFEIEPSALTNDLETGAWGMLAIMEQMWLSPEDAEFLLEMQAGETSHIIELFNMEMGQPTYVLVYVVSRDDNVDLDAAEAVLRNNWTEEGRGETFHELVLTWVEEANFRINERGYNTV